MGISTTAHHPKDYVVDRTSVDEEHETFYKKEPLTMLQTR